MSIFAGLYYPGESWDLEVEDSMLKKCLLFFDKVYAIVPEIFSVDWQDVQPHEELDPSLRDLMPFKLETELKMIESIEEGKTRFSPEQQEASLHELDRHVRITKFMDKIAILRKEGGIELVNPRENLLDPPYWGTNSKPYPWMEITSDYQTVFEQGLQLDNLEDHKPHILYGSILSDLKDEHFRNLAGKLGNERIIVYKGQAEQNWLFQLGMSSGFPEDEWQDFPSLVHYFGFPGTVSTVMWAALVVNHTLLTAHRYNLVPVTPSGLFWKLLQSKLWRMRTLTEADQLKERFFDHPEYKAGFSGFSLAALTLPNLELMSFEDVLDLRATLRDELIAFRYEMSTLAEHIREEPWHPNFLNELEYTVKNRIKPAIDNLQRKLNASTKEVVLRALKTATPTVLPVYVGIWAGMPPLLVMAIAAGLVSLETALEYHFKQKKTLQSNGLSLLLRLP